MPRFHSDLWDLAADQLEGLLAANLNPEEHPPFKNRDWRILSTVESVAYVRRCYGKRFAEIPVDPQLLKESAALLGIPDMSAREGSFGKAM